MNKNASQLQIAKWLGVLSCLGTAAISAPARAATTGANGSHDPSRMIECEGRVYVYSTGGGAKSSADGLNWKDEPTPTWNRTAVSNNQGIWAPDGLFLNGQYYLYGSMWSSDKSSAIVLLTSPTLNPSSAKYSWTDRGVAVPGPAGVTHSVIDPAPLLDADGNLWIVWGGGYPFASTADSIFLTPLDKKTGLALTSDPGYKPPNSPGYALEQGHKEGPYIHYHEGYYYLFYQTGSCCSGASSSYVIHVARSQSVKGPYSGDRTFYGSQSGIHGPGHMGVYSGCGFERFTYHYYPDSGGSVIGENELQWSGGWPAVGPESTKPLVLCGSNSGGAGGSSGGLMGGVSGSTAGSGSAGDSNSGGAPSGTPTAGSTDVAGAPAAGGLSDNGGTDASGGSTSSSSGAPSATAGSVASAGTSTIPGAGSSSGESPDTASGCSLGNGVKHERDGFLGSLVGLAVAVIARRRRS